MNKMKMKNSIHEYTDYKIHWGTKLTNREQNKT